MMAKVKLSEPQRKLLAKAVAEDTASTRVCEERQRAHNLMMGCERLVMALEAALPALEQAMQGVDDPLAKRALEGLREQLARLEELGDG
jgi:hypothetical protein